jgi:hypothetical protein
MIIWVAGAYLACGMVLALTVLLAGHPEWWRPLAAAASIAAMAAIISVSVLLVGLGRNPTATVAAVMAATGARLIFTLSGCVAAIVVGHIAAPPMLLFTVAFYFAVLISESAWVLGMPATKARSAGVAAS